MHLSVWYKDENYRRMVLIDRFEHPKFLINEAQTINLEPNYVMLQASSTTCTDNFDVYLHIDKNSIKDIKFVGEGCVISLTSSDLLIEQLVHKPIVEAIDLLEKYLLLVFDGKLVDNKKFPEALMLFDQIHKQSNRIICASNVAQKILTYLKGLK